jgi:hypothetical protein
MTLACPACRAENSQRTCRRCRADLGMLWDLEARRDRLLIEAAGALRERDWARAVDLAQAVLQLRNGADAVRLIACAYLLRGKFYRALEWHERAKSAGS